MCYPLHLCNNVYFCGVLAPLQQKYWCSDGAALLSQKSKLLSSLCTTGKASQNQQKIGANAFKASDGAMGKACNPNLYSTSPSAYSMLMYLNR